MTRRKPAAPVHLVARIDDDEFALFPDSSGLVIICDRTLSRGGRHTIRIEAPVLDAHVRELFEFEGLWLSKGGQLERMNGSLLEKDNSDEDTLEKERDQIGSKHRQKLGFLRPHAVHNTHELKAPDEDMDAERLQSRRKLLEVITDAPGSALHRPQSKGRPKSGAFSGMMGWESLLGEMFGADHSSVSIADMCLVQHCHGGVDQPAGLGDVFFRSGPLGSPYFELPWMFDAYIPDVVVCFPCASLTEILTNADSEYWQLRSTQLQDIRARL